jgi:hypothetical protein
MNDLETLTANVGLVRRELKDVRAVLARIDQQTQSVGTGKPQHGLVARMAACHLMPRWIFTRIASGE